MFNNCLNKFVELKGDPISGDFIFIMRPRIAFHLSFLAIFDFFPINNYAWVARNYLVNTH